MPICFVSRRKHGSLPYASGWRSIRDRRFLYKWDRDALRKISKSDTRLCGKSFLRQEMLHVPVDGVLETAMQVRFCTPAKLDQGAGSVQTPAGLPVGFACIPSNWPWIADQLA